MTRLLLPRLAVLIPTLIQSSLSSPLSGGHHGWKDEQAGLRFPSNAKQHRRRRHIRRAPPWQSTHTGNTRCRSRRQTNDRFPPVSATLSFATVNIDISSDWTKNLSASPTELVAIPGNSWDGADARQMILSAIMRTVKSVSSDRDLKETRSLTKVWPSPAILRNSANYKLNNKPANNGSLAYRDTTPIRSSPAANFH